jgi:phenazine biosynthesis protein phzE
VNRDAVPLPAQLPPEFVLLRRPGPAGDGTVELGDGTVELLAGPVQQLPALHSVPVPDDVDDSPVFLLVPYRTADERGFQCREDDAALLAMRVHTRRRVTLPNLPALDDSTARAVASGRFDIEDAEYEQIVRRVIDDEIGAGEGANFVISRSYRAEIPDYSVATALSVFQHLLRHERGAYWTFLVQAAGRTFVGATPERHITLSGGVATMNPISGTYRYPPGGPTVEGLVGFLNDGKESDELYMVLDEELKTMAAICDDVVRITGPRLRMMAHLAHTEYLISGRTALPPVEVLRNTLFAPTVVGSPLVNAFRVIKRHERTGRGYYSGVAALISRDEDGLDRLDSAILIRTAEIRPGGRLRIGVGATVVRHSRPAEEAAETRAKARGLLAAMGVGTPPAAPSGTDGRSPAAGRLPAGQSRAGRFRDGRSPQSHPDVQRVLRARNDRLNRFWFGATGTDSDALTVPGRPRVLVLDAEDTFTAMLGHHVRALGCPVEIQSAAKEFAVDDVDCVLLGPGPGNPLALDDPRIARLHDIVRELLRGRVPFLAVCLSHQILSAQLGLPIRRRQPRQGLQREITLFGEAQRVGSYNSYFAVSDRDRFVDPVHGAVVEVSRDRRTGEVHALRGTRFGSVQFHLESVLTQNGRLIAARLLAHLYRREPRGDRR